MKYYQLILSTKQIIEIDQEDFIKVSENLQKGRLVQVKQGIFNPSFVVAILPIHKEITQKIEGYIDEKTQTFIATKFEDKMPELKDEFSKDTKQLSEEMKI